MMKRIQTITAIIMVTIMMTITTIVNYKIIPYQELIIFTKRIRMIAMIARQVSLWIAFPTVRPNLIQIAMSNALPIAIQDVHSLNMAING